MSGIQNISHAMCMSMGSDGGVPVEEASVAIEDGASGTTDSTVLE